MNTKNNQRYQDTEKLIQDTLLSLAQDKEIHKVTVRAICEEAHINRSSFYLHYLDIHDLIFKMGQKMMEEVGEMMEDRGDVIDFFLAPDSMAQMIGYVKEHHTFFDIYLTHYTAEASESFSLLWESAAKPYMREHYSTIDESEMWYHFSFFKAGFISVLSQWLHRGCPETPERLAEIILRNLPSGTPKDNY